MATIALLLIVPNRNAFAQSAARPIPPAAAAITSDAWDTLSADITIRRVHVNQDGSPSGDAPETVQLHWERTQVAGGWRTTTTVVAASRRMARGPDGRDVPIPQKLTGTRVVDEADGSQLRVYDANGKELTAGRWNVAAALGGDPAAAATAATASRPTKRAPIFGREWADALVARTAARDRRQRALELRHGQPTSRVNGRDQYVSVQGETTTEVLVDPETALPVETNLSRGADLVAHTTFRYTPIEGSGLLRSGIHTERVNAGDRGRSVVDIEYANVRAERRR